MKEELKEILVNSYRYRYYILLDKPVKFNEFFKDKDIDCVQLHSTQIISYPSGKDIVGFCGQFSWKNNEIKSLDGDNYFPNMTVFGYEWFENKEEGIKEGIDILVDNNY